MNFSYEEQIIGKWVDGRNVYQRTFNMPLTNNLNITNSKDIDILVMISGSIKNEICIPMFNYISARVLDGDLYMYTGGAYNGDNVIFTVWYVKTED